MHKVITITGKQGPLLLPRSFNMKTIAQDLVRMLSFKLLYKAPELTVGKVTYYILNKISRFWLVNDECINRL